MTDAQKTLAHGDQSDTPSQPRMLAQWRWWLAPALLTLALAIIFADPFAGDWDAVDYTVFAIHGQPTSMFMGRMLFLFTNHAAWRIANTLFGMSVEHAYLLFKYMVVIESPLVIIAVWTLAHDLTRDVRAATIAALLVTLSPTFILYSGQAMTEIPSLLLLTLALVVHLRGTRRRKVWMALTGAALLGLNVNVREVMGLYGAWLVIAPFACGWRLARRELLITALACLIFFACAFAPFAVWFAFNVDNYRAGWWSWLDSVSKESKLHPVQFSNLHPLLYFFYIAAPLVLITFPFAAFREWREHKFSPLLALAFVGFFANLALFFIYSVVISGRYLLTGLPAIVPLTGAYLMYLGKVLWAGNARKAFATALLVTTLLMVWQGYRAYRLFANNIETHAYPLGYDKQLALLPRNAVLLGGAQTLAVTYWRGLGYGEWEAIGTGIGWPGNDRLYPMINEYLRSGRRVFIDTDTRWWGRQGWQLSETHVIVGLEQRFRFRHVGGTIYEIRPLTDQTANDAPNLRKLLPESESG